MRNENIFFKNKTEIGNTNVPIEQFATGNRITPTASATSVKEGTIAFSELGDLCYTKKDKNGVGRWFSLGLKINFNELKILTLNQKWSGTKGSYNGDVSISFGSSGKINIAPISINFVISREKTLGGYVISSNVMNFDTNLPLLPALFFVASQYSLNLWCDEVEKLLNNEIEVIWRYQSKDLQFEEEKYRNKIGTYLISDLYKVQSLFEAIDKELPKKLGNTSFTPTPRIYKGFNDFKDVKIIVDTPEKSKKFQELIFSLGGSWAQDVTTYVQETDSKYIYINGSVLLTSGSNEDFYKNNNKEEIFYDDVFPNESSTSSSTSSTTTDFNGYTPAEYISEMFALNQVYSALLPPDDLYNALSSKRLSKLQKLNISRCFGEFYVVWKYNDLPAWEMFCEAEKNFRNNYIPDIAEKFQKYAVRKEFLALIGISANNNNSYEISNGSVDDFNATYIYDEIFSKLVKNIPSQVALYEAYKEYYDKVVFGKTPSTPTTKKYTAEDFRNTKIIVDTPEKSTNLQNFLFSFGITWVSGDTEVLFPDYSYILVSNSLKISAGDVINSFRISPLKEIFYDDIFPDTNPTATSTSSKKYTLDDFRNTKIKVDTPEKSEKFQELVFSSGVQWADETQIIYGTDEKYIYIDNTPEMSCGSVDDNFLNKPYKEIFYDDIFPDTNTTKTSTPSKKSSGSNTFSSLNSFYETKIILDSEDESRKFQELVISLGATWDSDLYFNQNDPKFLNKKFLSINALGILDFYTYGDFQNSKYPEIFYKDIFPYTNTTAQPTKKYTAEDFKNAKIKISSVEQSKELQEFMFSLGSSWIRGGKRIIDNLNAKYYFINDDAIMSWGSDEEEFNKSTKKEFLFSDIFPDTNPTATPTKKTWTLDDFYGTKFRVRGAFYNQVSEEKGEERSKKFQELVFSLGVQWADETQKVKFTDKPYLYINYEGELDYGTYGADFLDSDYREIFYDDIFPKTNSIADMDFSSLFENALKSPTVTLNSVNPTKTLEELEQEYSDLLFLISVTPTINFKEVSELKQQASVLKDEIDASVLIIKDKLLTENNIFDELFTASSVQTKHRYDIKPYADGFAPDGTPTMLPKSIYELTLTDNFESWFGNFQSAYQFKNSPYTEVPCSIVKNIHYEPQIVYHGTGAQFSFFDFNNFPIMYFAENYYYAEWFAEQKGAENGTNGYVYPFFLDIKNPLDLTHFGIDEITPQEFVDWLYLQTGLEADELKINPAILQSKKPTWAWVYLRNGEEMLKVLRDTKLFDGIVYYEQNPPIKPTERNYKTKGFIIFASQSAKIVDPERYNLLVPSMRSFYLKKGGKL